MHTCMDKPAALAYSPSTSHKTINISNSDTRAPKHTHSQIILKHETTITINTNYVSNAVRASNTRQSDSKCKPCLGIGHRKWSKWNRRGQEWEEEMILCLYAVTRCFKICIRRYPGSVDYVVLCLSCLWLILLLRFIFILTRRLNVKSVRNAHCT